MSPARVDYSSSSSIQFDLLLTYDTQAVTPNVKPLHVDGGGLSREAGAARFAAGHWSVLSNKPNQRVSAGVRLGHAGNIFALAKNTQEPLDPMGFCGLQNDVTLA